jgi:hypothetical protein
MTPQDLEIYRLRLRVGLLERSCYSVLIGLMMHVGESLEGAKNILSYSIEDAEGEMEPGIPPYVDPAQQALAHDEFREIADGLKARVKLMR